MSEILFSIIIPTYNSEKTLIPCLLSIVNQKYISKEIIIVDGNSTDTTNQIIKKFQFQYSFIKTISEKDLGIYDAMNKGIRASNGEWLYFLGSDDSFFNDKILVLVNKHLSFHERSKIIYGDVLTSDGHIQKYDNHTYSKLVNLNICHQAIFYHKSLFKDFLYDLRYSICADWDMNLKVFRKVNHPAYINEIIAKFSLEGASKDWRVHPDYLGNFNTPKMIFRYRSIFYFLYLEFMKVFKRIRMKVLYKLSWIFR